MRAPVRLTFLFMRDSPPHAAARRLRGRLVRDAIRRVLPIRYRPLLAGYPRTGLRRRRLGAGRPCHRVGFRASAARAMARKSVSRRTRQVPSVRSRASRIGLSGQSPSNTAQPQSIAEKWPIQVRVRPLRHSVIYLGTMMPPETVLVGADRVVIIPKTWKSRSLPASPQWSRLRRRCRFRQ